MRNDFSEAERKMVRVFYCPGGFSYEKMSVGSKLMMKMFQKMVAVGAVIGIGGIIIAYLEYTKKDMH